MIVQQAKTGLACHCLAGQRQTGGNAWGRRLIKSLRIAAAPLTVGLAIALPAPGVAQELRLPDQQRWLEVREMRGEVIYWQGQSARPAQVGDRLQQLNQGIDTGRQSISVLSLDTDIGVVRLAENTSLRVRNLLQLADGGRVTALTVNRGQARLQVRRFTHRSSELEVETPAGVAAVRGTVFGVDVAPAGKTSVATFAGVVEASAQGVSVLVNPGFGTIIVPGEPPTPPRRLDRALRLQVGRGDRTGGRVIIRGQVDPINSVIIGDTVVETSPDGSFRASVSDSPTNFFADYYVEVRVRNPLGEERIHEVYVPDRS
ncbi:MAG: FecR family protein [Synechococcales bacterium]|nr:FecR family protein [Synechococcales bacterium]